MSPQHTSLKQKVDDHSQHHPGEFPCAKIVALQNDLDKVEQDLADKTEELLVLQRSYNRLKKEFDLKIKEVCWYEVQLEDFHKELEEVKEKLLRKNEALWESRKLCQELQTELLQAFEVPPSTGAAQCIQSGADFVTQRYSTLMHPYSAC
ncbi:hypothetical protein L208DRAFT_1379656 [Tricholoma matsutake]|nr:hypothetical protein L208DRAFT_1379656 [Tricholoma matsutake 945]